MLPVTRTFSYQMVLNCLEYIDIIFCLPLIHELSLISRCSVYSNDKVIIYDDIVHNNRA